MFYQAWKRIHSDGTSYITGRISALSGNTEGSHISTWSGWYSCPGDVGKVVYSLPDLHTFVTSFRELKEYNQSSVENTATSWWSIIVVVNTVLIQWSRGFIKGQAPGKLTGCERDLAINLPGCFRLLFLLSFVRKTKNARLKNPTDLLHKNLMKPLVVGFNLEVA